MKKGFAILCLINGIYDLILGIIFLAAPQLLSSLLSVTIDPIGTMLAQIIGSCLIGLGIGLLAAYRNIEGLLILPVMKIFAHLIAVVIGVYYYLLVVVPSLFLVFVGVDAFFGIVTILFFLFGKDYSFSAAFASS